MNNSIEQEAKKLSQRVLLVLGPRLNTFYQQRFAALDNYLDSLLERHNGCQDKITDAEIEGAYEMVTEHLFSLVDLIKLPEVTLTLTPTITITLTITLILILTLEVHPDGNGN